MALGPLIKNALAIEHSALYIDAQIKIILPWFLADKNCAKDL